MKIEVTVTTAKAQGVLIVEGNGLSDCFEQLPLRAAAQGLGLINDGPPVTYSVKILA